MTRTCFLLLCIAGLASWAGPPAGFKVVVNEKTALTSLTRAQLTLVFLKKSATFEDGRPAVPIDLPDDAPARKAFTEDVLKRSVNAVKAYWQQRIFSGRGVPPIEKSTDEEVVAAVKSKEGGVGYVSPSADVTGVKVVTVTD